ncbi:MAG: hypothetical protein PHT48_09565 [Dechloromonas sp.]|nr:hypothetical protein [Dechloromonas sp.]
MFDFAQQFPNDLLINSLGDTVSYKATADSEPVTIKAIINHGLNQAAVADAYRPQPSVTIEALKTDVPGIKRKSTFTYGALVYTVDAIDDDDGYVVRVVVK